MPFCKGSDDDRVIWDVTLEYQSEVYQKALEYGEPTLLIEGVLNDTTVFDLSGFCDDEGTHYQYVILGYDFANDYQNVLYVQYTNDDNVFEKWVKEYDQQVKEYEDS